MRREPRQLLVTFAGFLLVIALPGCSNLQTSQQADRLSSACQIVRSGFVEMENKSIEGTRATIDALNHYSDAFNGVTSGRVPSGSPQYQATMKKMQADRRAATTAITASQQKGALFRAAIARCDTGTLPKGCLAEWDHFRLSLKQEAREAKASATALRAATKMVATWNAAGARVTPATNAAISQYNAARDALSARVDEHNRLTGQYRTVQEACTKAAQG